MALRSRIGCCRAAMERIRRKLAGADDGNRQMVDILVAVLTDGLPAVEAACAEALADGVHSADVILNILARQRDPVAPITILTPDALKLRHEPVADCARYDNLCSPAEPAPARRISPSRSLVAASAPGRGAASTMSSISSTGLRPLVMGEDARLTASFSSLRK
jgi:hypothetical protein